MSEMVIQTEDLSKVFKDFWQRPRVTAVSGLTFGVERGQVYGLLGPNGSGKSTTIKMLLGLLFPSSGQIAIFGRRPEDVETKRRIGFLPEESYLYKYLNAEETLDFYGRLFNLPRAERRLRIEALLRLTGLVDARKRLLGEYSKGMARRIGVAQALINDPELVILDEPTTGLDPLGTREMKDLIVQLKEKGKTVLLCSHLLADVEDVCDRVLIMYGGRLRREGKTKDLLRQENLTQITAEMDENTVKEVVELIRKRQGDKGDIKVHPPLERLENLFLRVIEEARQMRMGTSGVGATDSNLAFITSAKKPEEILDRLTKAAEATPAVPGTQAATSPSQPSADADLLSGLLKPKGGAAVAEPERKPAPGPEEKLNRSVLDQLSGKPEDDK